MYDMFIDKICFTALKQISERIIHEIVCVFEITTLNSTANNLVDIVEKNLFGSIIDMYIIKE